MAYFNKYYYVFCWYITDVMLEVTVQDTIKDIGNLAEKGDSRNRYIRAVRKADNGDFSDLLAFARS